MRFSNPGKKETFINKLLERGLMLDEANRQYDAEKYVAEKFTSLMAATYAAGMKITFGTVR
ncbi:hypothetical protein [Alkalihalobacillus pseudalcaliphilus]|uniref:hypothetical protein n=1 Tax=Alkalihalobacillus pseudalcaliphilus TaxID=79884 RepID=UPI000A97BB4A|nr:hypothetical protein [Alkalihalobacillus pseudalcaliphilus]